MGVDVVRDRDYVLSRVKVDPQSGCWLWCRSVTPSGYGQVGQWPWSAHRLAYSLWRGEIGDSLIRHKCHTPACCNPEHLEIGDHSDNYWDSRTTHVAASAKRRGRPATNRAPVTFRGTSYPSMSHAQRATGASWRTIRQQAVRVAEK